MNVFIVVGLTSVINASGLFKCNTLYPADQKMTLNAIILYLHNYRRQGSILNHNQGAVAISCLPNESKAYLHHQCKTCSNLNTQPLIFHSLISAWDLFFSASFVDMTLFVEFGYFNNCRFY